VGYKKRKKKKNEIETMSEEDYYGYYFIAGFTDGGAPYGITREEAEEQGLLEDEKNPQQTVSDDDLPF